MGSFIDLSGKILGNWTVLHKDEETWIGGKKNISRKWVCRCVCGNTHKIAGGDLRANPPIPESCGCLSRPQSHSLEIGQRFDHWTVLAKTYKITTKGVKATQWLCQCKCGTKRVKSAWELVKGLTKSCGCAKPDYYETWGKSKTPLYQIHNSAKTRSKKYGIPFDLKLSDIVVPEFCPLLGIRLQHHKRNGKNAGFEQDSPSLDRIIPEKGYVKGNVWVISLRANTIKNNATLKEIQNVAANLEKKINELNSNFGENERGTFGSGASLDRQQHTVSLSQ